MTLSKLRPLIILAIGSSVSIILNLYLKLHLSVIDSIIVLSIAALVFIVGIMVILTEETK